MLGLYNELLFRPILNLLVALYDLLFNDAGLAIIALTFIVRALLWPLTHKSLHSQRAMLEIQPKLNELKRKHKDNKEEQAKAMMALYAEEKISPFSSCLPLLVQLPLFIALYQALTAGLKSEGLNLLYGFVPNPGHISTVAFGFLDLSAASIPLAVMAAAGQYFQAKMMQTKRPEVKGEASKDEDMGAMMNKQMLYMMPVMTLFIGWKLPAGLTLYWLLTNLAMIIQQKFFMKDHKHREPGVDAPPKA
jgi:YidC/Oxa1 family membrane protein insertase